MKVIGLLIVIVGLVAFGTVIADKFEDSRQDIDGAIKYQQGCRQFTEFECIAKSDCSPVYEKDTARSLAQGLPTYEQGRGLNKVTIGGVYLGCEEDAI